MACAKHIMRRALAKARAASPGLKQRVKHAAHFAKRKTKQWFRIVGRDISDAGNRAFEASAHAAAFAATTAAILYGAKAARWAAHKVAGTEPGQKAGNVAYDIAQAYRARGGPRGTSGYDYGGHRDWSREGD